jgi:hypothetical protein
MDVVILPPAHPDVVQIMDVESMFRRRRSLDRRSRGSDTQRGPIVTDFIPSPEALIPVNTPGHTLVANFGPVGDVPQPFLAVPPHMGGGLSACLEGSLTAVPDILQQRHRR